MGQHTGQAPVYPSTYSYISSSTIRSLPAYTLPAIHDKDFRYYVRHRTVGQTAAKRQTGRVLVHANRPESRHFQLLEILGDAALTTSLVEHIYSHTKEAGDPGLVTMSKCYIVNNDALGLLALVYKLHTTSCPPFEKDLCVDDYHTYSKNTRKQLADMFEAYIGALWKEGRHEEVQDWLGHVFCRLMGDAWFGIGKSMDRKLPDAWPCCCGTKSLANEDITANEDMASHTANSNNARGCKRGVWLEPVLHPSKRLRLSD